MRISVEDQIGLEAILDRRKSRVAFQASVSDFIEKSVLLVDESQWRSQVRNLKNEQGLLDERLQVLVDHGPMILRKDFGIAPQATLSESGDDDSPLDHLLISKEWKQSKQSLENAILEGTSRDDVYRSKLGYIMPGVSTFYYIDQFFHKKLLARSSGAWYLLERLIEDKVQNIEIKTAAIFNDGIEGLRTSKEFAEISHKRNIEHRIEELLRKFGSRETTVNITVYRKTLHGLPHDRMGFLTLRKNKLDIHTLRSIYFHIGPGIDLFSNEYILDKVVTAGNFNLEDPKPLREIGAHLEQFEIIKAKY